MKRAASRGLLAAFWTLWLGACSSDTTPVTPPTPSPTPTPVMIPELVSPAQGAVMDNGCTPPNRNAIVWDFDWSDVPQASRYHLFVIGPGARIPVIDNAGITASLFHNRIPGAYVAEQNRFGWEWRVRADVNGAFGEYSPIRFFNVEPVDTDCQ